MLPLGHDYLIPEALAEAAAKKNGDVWLPPVTYGVSGTLDSYPGTITVSAQFLQKYVEAIVTSAPSAPASRATAKPMPEPPPTIRILASLMLMSGSLPRQSGVEASRRWPPPLRLR